LGVDEGLPSGIVYDFAEDRNGGVWAAVAGGLAVNVGDRWERAGHSFNYSADDARWVIADSRGAVWVAASNSVFRLSPGKAEFERFDVHIPSGAILAEARDGSIWLSDHLGGTRALTDTSGDVLPRAAPPSAWVDLKAHRMLWTRDGKLWATDHTHGGVHRVAADAQRTVEPSAIESFHERDGLTAEASAPIFDDRENNVWVGTRSGLDQFRRRKVQEFAPAREPGSLFAITSDELGSVFITAGGKLFRTDGETTEELMSGLPRTTAAAASPNGELFLLTKERLLKVRHGRLDTLPIPEDLPDLADILALAVDDSGAPWISLAQNGVYRFADPAWEKVHPIAARVLYRDSRGGMWMGFPNDRVVAQFRGEQLDLSSRDGLDIGNVTAIFRDGEDVLVAGEKTLSRYRNGRMISLAPTTDREPFQSITGMTDAKDGTLWLNGERGVVRIERSELDRAFLDSNYRPLMTVVDSFDGFPGIAAQGKAAGTAARTADGTLWFTGNRGIGWIDASDIYRNTLAPFALIESIDANGKTYKAADGLTLPALTTSVRIAYTATSLSIPKRVRFEFKLEGADRQWVDGRNRREVFYTNLGPGHYRFQLRASNEDGVWSTKDASLPFDIAPTVFQTKAFLLACAVAALLFLWMALLWRIRQISRQVRDRIEERHRERDRIARELHDTLLQGFQGSVYRVQAAAESIPADSAPRVAIERALDLADQALVDGRRRVAGLRGEEQETMDLAAALARVGDEFAPQFDTTLRVLIEGNPRTLQLIVRDDLYQIGREAISNAFRHASANVIEVEIIYGDSELCLRIRDDGCGIDPSILDRGGRPGHWGLAGMRERARSIGAAFRILGAASAGTETEVRVPADQAYVDHVTSNWRDALDVLWMKSRNGRS
jgi:signal transduction histidine kinase/ligand-binding sensor domain-containing protein